MAIITAAELNYIIYRYFTESGFMHTAFMFDSEAGIKKSPIYGTLIPNASLITLIVKGLEFMEMEEKLKKGENYVDKDLSLLQVMMNTIKKDKDENGEQKVVIDQKNKQYMTRAAKLDINGKARKAPEREEAERARESEEAERKSRERGEADRMVLDKKVRRRGIDGEREEAERKAREKKEADRSRRDTDGGERRMRRKMKNAALLD